MSEQSTNRPLVFSVIEDDGENVTIEISEEDYQRDLEAGISERSRDAARGRAFLGRFALGGFARGSLL